MEIVGRIFEFTAELNFLKASSTRKIAKLADGGVWYGDRNSLFFNV